MSRSEIHKMLGRQMNAYVSTIMLILLFQAYCNHNIRLKLEKHTENHYTYKKSV